jgi:hypothetical protein
MPVGDLYPLVLIVLGAAAVVTSVTSAVVAVLALWKCRPEDVPATVREVVAGLRSPAMLMLLEARVRRGVPMTEGAEAKR